MISQAMEVTIAKMNAHCSPTVKLQLDQLVELLKEQQKQYLKDFAITHQDKERLSVELRSKEREIEENRLTVSKLTKELQHAEIQLHSEKSLRLRQQMDIAQLLTNSQSANSSVSPATSVGVALSSSRSQQLGSPAAVGVSASHQQQLQAYNSLLIQQQQNAILKNDHAIFTTASLLPSAARRSVSNTTPISPPPVSINHNANALLIGSTSSLSELRGQNGLPMLINSRAGGCEVVSSKCEPDWSSLSPASSRHDSITPTADERSPAAVLSSNEEGRLQIADNGELSDGGSPLNDLERNEHDSRDENSLHNLESLRVNGDDGADRSPREVDVSPRQSSDRTRSLQMEPMDQCSDMDDTRREQETSSPALSCNENSQSNLVIVDT